MLMVFVFFFHTLQQRYRWFGGVQFQPDRYKRRVQRAVQVPGQRRFGMGQVQSAASAQPRPLPETGPEPDTRLVQVNY